MLAPAHVSNCHNTAKCPRICQIIVWISIPAAAPIHHMSTFTRALEKSPCKPMIVYWPTKLYWFPEDFHLFYYTWYFPIIQYFVACCVNWKGEWIYLCVYMKWTADMQLAVQQLIFMFRCSIIELWGWYTCKDVDIASNLHNNSCTMLMHGSFTWNVTHRYQTISIVEHEDVLRAMPSHILAEYVTAIIKMR